jgi:predicted GIY-YIG superfamily endonuclease
MKYVYLIRSLQYPGKRYVGITSGLEKRLEAHNAGQSVHTALFKPWKLVVAVQFENNDRAAEFETYLKSGSGHAFARRHLW